MLEKTLESPLDSKEIQPVHPSGNQPWIFTGRTDAEAETPILWPPDAKNWVIGKDPDAEKGWRQEEKGMTGWDGWVASPTQWTWVWANSGSWWCHLTISSCHPLLFLPSIISNIRVFSNQLALCIRWPGCWSFSFSISLSNEYSGLISFRIDELDLLAVQGALKSLL